MEKISINEVMQLGVQIEKNGEKFYTQMIEITDNEKVKKVFDDLRKEEIHHIKFFQSLIDDNEVVEYGQFPDQYFAYIKSLADEHIFTNDKKAETLTKNVKTEIQAVDIAIGFEKDSILFYSEVKEMMPKEHHDKIDRVIEEERSHFRSLAAFKKLLMSW